jgi:hypothetical protein
LIRKYLSLHPSLKIRLSISPSKLNSETCLQDLYIVMTPVFLLDNQIFLDLCFVRDFPAALQQLHQFAPLRAKLSQHAPQLSYLFGGIDFYPQRLVNCAPAGNF